ASQAEAVKWPSSRSRLNGSRGSSSSSTNSAATAACAGRTAAWRLKSSASVLDLACCGMLRCDRRSRGRECSPGARRKAGSATCDPRIALARYRSRHGRSDQSRGTHPSARSPAASPPGSPGRDSADPSARAERMMAGTGAPPTLATTTLPASAAPATTSAAGLDEAINDAFAPVADAVAWLVFHPVPIGFGQTLPFVVLWLLV